jgi:hypothetical protein
MAISDTSFFNNYQGIIGSTYAKGFEQVYNPSSTLINYYPARQLFLSSMSTSDVQNGISVINAHLTSENTYSSASLNIARSVAQVVNTFFSNTYGTPLRDYFYGLIPSRNVAWQNSFKSLWYQSNAQELVQQVGFATWTGANFVIFPANSSVTNMQNKVTISSISGSNVAVTGFQTSISNFALPGDIIVASLTANIPSATAIALNTTVTGYYNSNTLTLSGIVSSNATTLFAFRPIQNPEYLEFRFGTSSLTGGASTGIVANLGLTVYLSTGVSTSVTLNTTNTIGRANIGIYNNSTYKSLGITSIAVASGSVAGLGTIPALEVWVKSTN